MLFDGAVRPGCLPGAIDTSQVTGLTTSNLAAAAGITAAQLASSAATEFLNFIFENSGSVIATGVAGDIICPFACTIQSVTMLADQSGSMVVEIWKNSYANYPPTIADKITASAPPTLSAAAKSQDTTLTGWTTAIAAGDTLRFNVNSASTVTRVILQLKVLRT